ncbi:MAG TPA: glutathione S-transferase [Aurantimonas coralicida]|uniref:Glutathione S-transferase n=2 Tax=root TaxID=1 RepID=A0A9C9NGY6_9HYPH|nr:glutathione S-transferase [Aurantimonas coralicida]HEU01104.1 glutathione S-transferase [Aurantimonas coralicida]
MRLYYSSASPFAAKARMAARHCGIEIESVAVDTSAEPVELTSANPLGKIPVLVLDDGTSVYDSRVICDLFDRMSGNQLVPQELDAWRTVKTFEAAADGVGDALILTVYEVRYRPEEKRHQAWVDKQMRKADRGLAFLEDHVNELSDEPTTAHFALAGLLGWMAFRFAGKIESERPKLAQWLKQFPESFPDYDELQPRAA